MRTSEQKVLHRTQASHNLMMIEINGISKQVGKDSNLEQIVKQLGLPQSGYVFSIGGLNSPFSIPFIAPKEWWAMETI